MNSKIKKKKNLKSTSSIVTLYVTRLNTKYKKGLWAGIFF